MRRLRARHDRRHLSHHPVRQSLVNGPAAARRTASARLNPENDCAWIQIYKRLEQLGQLDKLSMTRAGQEGL